VTFSYFYFAHFLDRLLNGKNARTENAGLEVAGTTTFGNHGLEETGVRESCHVTINYWRIMAQRERAPTSNDDAVTAVVDEHGRLKY